VSTDLEIAETCLLANGWDFEPLLRLSARTANPATARYLKSPDFEMESTPEPDANLGQQVGPLEHIIVHCCAHPDLVRVESPLREVSDHPTHEKRDLADHRMVLTDAV
jgi:hypothetical protein